MLEKYSIQNDLELSAEIKANTVLIHFWQVNAILLGKLDTLLPQYQSGVDYLIKHDYRVDVRKQGGLAIVSDNDNLNISFIFKTSDFHELHKPYKCVATYIAHAVRKMGLNVEIKNIHNSYCPGDYDLSVNGIKFAGIAQYRNKETIIVSVSLFVSGDQKRRSEIIKSFYVIAEADKSNKQQYPLIDINSMATLSDLLGKEVSINVVKESLREVIFNICE